MASETEVTRPNNRQHSTPPTSALRSIGDSLYEAELNDRPSATKTTKLDNTSFIPRSILRTARRVKKELNPDPTMEYEVLNDFRSSKRQTRAATQFVLLLIILPLLTQQFSKNIIISPIVDRFKGPEQD